MLLISALLGASAAPSSVASGAAASRTATCQAPQARLSVASADRSSDSSRVAPVPLRLVAGEPTFEPPVPPRAWNTIVLHHSATSGGDVASIDAAHRQQRDAAGKPWLGIGYHFVIGNGRKMGDGETQPTFRWLKQLPGAHAGKREYNDRGIGICLIGNFEEAAPTVNQVAAARRLVRLLAERHAMGRESVVRHLDVQTTACPGRLFPWDKIVDGLPLAIDRAVGPSGEKTCADRGPRECNVLHLTIQTRN